MNFFDVVLIALSSLKAKINMVKRITYCCSIMLVILICSAILLFSYFRYEGQYDSEKYRKECYYYEAIDGENCKDALGEKAKYELKKHGKKSNSNQMVAIEEITLKSEKKLAAENVKIEIDDVFYSGENYTNNKGNYVFYKNIVEPDSAIEIANFYNEMILYPINMEKNGRSVFIAGSYPSNQGEIILDDYMLAIYGIDKDPQELVDKVVNIYVDEGTKKEKVLNKYKIVGILNSQKLIERESLETPDVHLEHIFVNLFQKDTSRFQVENGSIRFYFENYDEYIKNYDENVLKSNFQSIFSEDKKLQLTQKGLNYCIVTFLVKSVGRVLLLVVGVILIISITIMIYLMYFFFNERKKTVMIFELLGMNKFARKCELTVELFVILVISFLVSAYISFLLLRVINYATNLTLDFPILFC